MLVGFCESQRHNLEGEGQRHESGAGQTCGAGPVAMGTRSLARATARLSIPLFCWRTSCSHVPPLAGPRQTILSSVASPEKLQQLQPTLTNQVFSPHESVGTWESRGSGHTYIHYDKRLPSL